MEITKINNPEILEQKSTITKQDLNPEAQMQTWLCRIINDLEDRTQIIESEGGNGMKKPPGIMELWDAIKRNNICIMTISEGKEKGQE